MIADLARFLLLAIRAQSTTQSDLANRAGLSRELLNRIINGKVAEPTRSTLARLAFALDVHPRALIRLLMEGMPLGGCHYNESEFDDSGFVQDVSYPEHSLVSCGERFTKILKLQNLGNVRWSGWVLRCVDAGNAFFHRRERPDGHFEYLPVSVFLTPEQTEVAIAETAPGATVEIAAVLVAPPIPGSVITRWQMFDQSGRCYFPDYPELTCQVQVISGGRG